MAHITIQRDLVSHIHLLQYILRLPPLGLIHNLVLLRRSDGQRTLDGSEFFGKNKGRVCGEPDVDETGFEEATGVFPAEAVTYCAEAFDTHFGAHGVDDGGHDGVDAGGGVVGEPGLQVEFFDRGYS